MRFDSILVRVISLNFIALAIAAAAVPLGSYLLLSSTANSFENQTLRAHAAEISRHLQWSAYGWKLRLPANLELFYARGFDGFAFSVIDDAGKVIASSHVKGLPLSEGRSYSQRPDYFQKQVGKHFFYGARIPEQIAGRRIWIEVAQDLEHPDVILDDVVADFLRRIVWFTLPILLLVLTTNVLVVRRALRPVSAASALAREIQPAQLQARIPAEGLPAEIRPLVSAFNEVLDRLEQAFQVQREFTADAAHELRTPLAVLRARADSLPDSAFARQIRNDIDVMGHIVDELLTVADLDSRFVELEEILDIRNVLNRVVEHLAPIAHKEAKEISVSYPVNPILVRGDAELLFQAFRNLAENALRHTPEGTMVELVWDGDGTVQVTDFGPGIPEGDMEHIFQRFWRRDRSRAGGAGLGLPIAARIIRAHGGTLSVTNRIPAGAVFAVRLPSNASVCV